MESTAEIRRRRLRQWIDERYAGSQTSFVAGTDLSVSQLGQWLGGHRNMTEGSARQIEQKKRMPPGWLDGREDTAADSLSILLQGLKSLDERTIRMAIKFQSLSDYHRRIVEAVASMPPPDEEDDDAAASKV